MIARGHKPYRVTLYIVEIIHYGSGCGYPIAVLNCETQPKSFVCHTTPHLDSTSREVSYSVPPHHTRKSATCKY